MILNATVHLGSFCSLATCDVDGDGVVGATDAVMVLQSAVGLTLDGFDCGPVLGIYLAEARAVDAVEFTIGYGQANVALSDRQGRVFCQSALAEETRVFAVSRERVADAIRIRIESDQPLTGETALAECRFFPDPGAPQLPEPTAFDVVLRDYAAGSAAKKPPVLAATITTP